MADLLDRPGVVVVLDVQPAQPGPHRPVLLKNLQRRVALHDDVGRVKDEHQRRVVDLAVDLGQKMPGSAHQVGLDLQAEGQVGAVTRLGDLAELIDRLRKVVLGLGAPGMIEGEAADQLGLEGVGQLADLLDFPAQIRLERDVLVAGPVVDVQKLHFADG